MPWGVFADNVPLPRLVRVPLPLGVLADVQDWPAVPWPKGAPLGTAACGAAVLTGIHRGPGGRWRTRLCVPVANAATGEGYGLMELAEVFEDAAPALNPWLGKPWPGLSPVDLRGLRRVRL